MKWLHISDIHFCPESDNESTLALRDDLPKYLLKLSEKVDEVFITGDFRFAKTQEDSDTVAKEAVDYLKKIAARVGVTDMNHIHVVPGNHDLNRDKLGAEIKDIRNQYNLKDGSINYDIEKLEERFSFFKRINKFLYNADYNLEHKRIGNSPHLYQCKNGYSIIYLNTALLSERGGEKELLIGHRYVGDILRKIEAENPDCILIVLAHHSMRMIYEAEWEKLENKFRDSGDVLYLCGHSHTLWHEKINNIHQITMGCIKQETDVQAGFSIGELNAGARQIKIKSYTWDDRQDKWGIYSQFGNNGEIIIEPTNMEPTKEEKHKPREDTALSLTLVLVLLVIFLIIPGIARTVSGQSSIYKKQDEIQKMDAIVNQIIKSEKIQPIWEGDVEYYTLVNPKLLIAKDFWSNGYLEKRVFYKNGIPVAWDEYIIAEDNEGYDEFVVLKKRYISYDDQTAELTDEFLNDGVLIKKEKYVYRDNVLVEKFEVTDDILSPLPPGGAFYYR